MVARYLKRGMHLKAIETKHFAVQKWLHETFGQALPEKFVDNFSCVGNLEILSWLHSSHKGMLSKETMDTAAANGQLDIHKNRRKGCTKAAMDEPAKNDHFDVVSWLHEM
ncbi:hypothetical protein PHMEG_00017457 [Phytophthora megakarya]|uniref:Uncharacterized protein n=1 Tax=Phytophthora megakarya TaxID=4795 RepID=A0A225VYD6_9STRA|nr:hypothetical protein PHMEG_00017457 [Phytophthora megakarya]